MAYAIKAEIADPLAETFDFPRQKTMYGGKAIARGDTIYLFASETEGGQGLVARGIVTAAEAIASLQRLGVQVKLITGDSRRVGQHVAGLVGLRPDRVLTMPEGQVDHFDARR